MKDVFYTILVVWIIWRVLNSISTIRSKQAGAKQTNANNRRTGDTTVDYVPPQSKSKFDDAGEYVDYEEIK
jgi:hypothetical protein